MKTWKQHAASHIRWVVQEHPTDMDEKELRKLISDNYPFGLRKYHPYKAWLKAVKEFFEERNRPQLIKLQPDHKPTCSPDDYIDTPLFSEVNHE